MSRFLPLLLALVSGAVLAQEPTPEQIQQSINAVQRLVVQRPGDPTLHYYLASFYARAKQRDKSLASLRNVYELGDGFMPGDHFGFESLKNDPDYITLRSYIERKLPIIADATLAFRIPDKTFAPEGIAFDAHSKSFFMGSVTHKKIVRISLTGKITPFSDADDGLQQVLGVAVDAKRRDLYAVSTNALTQGKPLHNSVFAFDIKTGKRNAEYQVPEALQLNDVAVAPNGDLYASDSQSGAIWKISTEPGSTIKPKAFVPAGTLGGSNGLAVSPDGKILYVAHSTGLVRVDIDTGAVSKLAPPPRETVAAIDGLYLHRGDLIGIQNITSPGRVIRVRLNEKGTEIERVDTLQSHHNPLFSQPTTGAISGNAIFVLGTTQLPRFNDKGEIENVGELKNPLVVRVPLWKL